ncbi:NACHT domain-containing protein [Candidatus Poribacteria bacterium]|nr:NACHT domain-containing protein [Candidatus Poribacteria bacterium]
MKTMKRILAKRWYLYLLMLFVMVCVAAFLSAQERQDTSGAAQQKVEAHPQTTQQVAADAKPESAKAGEDKGTSSTSEKKKEDSQTSKEPKTIGAWLRKHHSIMSAVIAFIFGLLFSLLFGNPFFDFVRNRFHPLLTRFFTRILIVCGGYNRLLKNYQQTLQRELQKVGPTQQLFGEGVDMERNYIPIQLSKEEFTYSGTIPFIETQRSGEMMPHLTRRTDARAEVDDVLKKVDEDGGNRTVIIGDPGSGKTTLMQYLAYQCTKGEGVKPIPVLITLTAYVKSEAKIISSHIEAIFEKHGFPKAKDYIEEQLKEGRFLILFDGFDEVEIQKREKLREEIELFAINAEYLRNTFVVTSRPIRDAVFDNFRHLEVMPLTAEQRRIFLESKIDYSESSDFNAEKCAELVKTIEAHNRIRKLAENPLLLTFLYHVYKYNLELPRRRVELYRLSVELMLDWDIKKGRPERIKVRDRDAKKEVLKKVAYYCHSNHVRELTEEDLKAQVEANLPDSLRGKFTAEELIEEIELSSGILRHRAAGTYQFIHPTFQEYLTADYINDNRDAEITKLMMELRDEWWREVTPLLAGIMRNATPLVKQILDYEQKVSDELEKRACLFMAFICAYEVEVDDEVRNQVFEAFTGLAYAQAAEGIQSVMGPIEYGNEALETLLLNILNSPYETVQVWGLGFLKDYPQIAEKSERLMEKLIPLTIELGGFREGVHDVLHFSDEAAQKQAWQKLTAIHNAPNQVAIDEYLRSLAPEGMALIPAGEFQMGSHDGGNNEKPLHTVYLNAFYIDVYPVTNTQYRKFIEATGHPKPQYWNDESFNQPQQPVVGVTWYDAMAYAEWSGKRLPTEAEWEKAARGGLVGKKYPWGDEEPNDKKANYAENVGKTTPVGSYPPNGYGLYDMAGNVWEWCLDEYKEDFYKTSPQNNPLAGLSLFELLANYQNIETRRVLRGGRWSSETEYVLRGGKWIRDSRSSDPNCLRVALRNWYLPVSRHVNDGFRCVVPRFP